MPQCWPAGRGEWCVGCYACGRPVGGRPSPRCRRLHAAALPADAGRCQALLSMQQPIQAFSVAPVSVLDSYQSWPCQLHAAQACTPPAGAAARRRRCPSPPPCLPGALPGLAEHAPAAARLPHSACFGPMQQYGSLLPLVCPGPAADGAGGRRQSGGVGRHLPRCLQAAPPIPLIAACPRAAMGAHGGGVAPAPS